LSGNLRQQYSRKQRTTEVLLLLPAGAAGVYLYAAYEMFLEPQGMGLWGQFLAAVAALTNTVIYWLTGVWLLTLVAQLTPAERRRLTPAIVGLLLYILGSSALPSAMKAARGTVEKQEAQSYGAFVEGQADAVITGVRRFEGLKSVLDDCAATFDKYAVDERQGRYSGFAAESGPVITWLETRAAKCRETAATIAPAGEAGEKVMARIKEATAAMRAALEDASKSPTERLLAMRGAADDFRSAVIELANKLPVARIDTLAKFMQSETARPVLSTKPHVRAGQENALKEFTGTARQVGKDLEGRVAAIMSVLSKGIPAYDPAPLPILLFKHGLSVLPILAAVIAMDCMVFVLYLFSARVNDALRARGEEVEDAHSLTVLDLLRARKADAALHPKEPRVDWGPREEPHPRPTRARLAEQFSHERDAPALPNGAADPAETRLLERADRDNDPVGQDGTEPGPSTKSGKARRRPRKGGDS
jgi:hypothetical protein